MQVNCDPILGLQQLAEVIKRRLANDKKAQGLAEKRRKVAIDRHKAIRAQQQENARKGWDDTPIRLRLRELAQARRQGPVPPLPRRERGPESRQKGRPQRAAE